MDALTSSKHVEIEAVVFPPCKCGKSWEAHGSCVYDPDGPIRDYGTVQFVSNDWVANLLFVLERLIKQLRLRKLGWQSQR
jgi:hypothetical protein